MNVHYKESKESRFVLYPYEQFIKGTKQLISHQQQTVSVGWNQQTSKNKQMR